MIVSQPLLFNPSRASMEELEQTFVGRWPLLEQIQSDLLADAKKRVDRHWMLVGPRGSGKSHLTELLGRRLSRDHGWAVVRLSEEQYQVANLAQLLEQIVMRLEQLSVSPFPGRADVDVQELALDRLRTFRKKHPRPILVVLENLGHFFERKLNRAREQKRLREIISRESPFVLLTTATGYVEATLKESAPFYDFFHAKTIDELSRDEVASLVEARAQWDREDTLLSQPELVRSRVESVYHFSGGNPRLVLDLYSILRQGITDDLHKQLLRLLDEVTPYYQARLRDITPQMERVLTEMALAGERLTPADVGRRCHLPTSQVTANIAKLEMERLVRPTGRPDGRRRYYEVWDRLLRLWMQMREDSSRSDRLRPLTEFFQRWYDGHADELAESAQRVGNAFWRDLEAQDSRRCKEKFNTMEYLEAASISEPNHSLLVHAIKNAREASNPSALRHETDLLQKQFATTPAGQYRALLGLLIAERLHHRCAYKEELRMLESVREEATGGLRFELWDRSVIAADWAFDSTVALETGLKAVEADPSLYSLKATLVGLALRTGRIAEAMLWLTEFVAASKCHHCQWRLLSKTCVEFIVEGLASEARAVSRQMGEFAKGHRLHRDEWLREIKALGTLIGKQGQRPSPSQWLSAVRLQDIEAVPFSLLSAAACSVAHAFGRAADAFPLLVELSRRAPLSEHDLDHVALALIDALELARPDTQEMIVKAASCFGPERLQQLFVESMPALCRDNPRRAPAILEAYRRLRDLGVLSNDMKPWSVAAVLEKDPDREKKLLALHPEVREAIELLLKPLAGESTPVGVRSSKDVQVN